VPTATLFAAGMGTPLPTGIIHPAGDSSLAISSTASLASMETSTSTSSSSALSSTTTSSTSTMQLAATSALVLGSISEVKSELAEVKDELSAVHVMQMEMREMKRRLGQLEEDNAQLKGTVIELRTQVGGGGGGARSGQFRVEAPGGQQGPPLKKIRWMGHEALSPEMLWCFPFLEHINISRSNFVVDDLEYVPHATRNTQHDSTRNTQHNTQHNTIRHTTHDTKPTIANHAFFFARRNDRKAILVLSFYPGKWTESTAFANQQFCNVSGFSLVRRPLLIIIMSHTHPIYIKIYSYLPYLYMFLCSYVLVLCSPALLLPGGAAGEGARVGGGDGRQAADRPRLDQGVRGPLHRTRHDHLRVGQLPPLFFNERFVRGSPVDGGGGRRGWWCGRHRKLTGYGDIVHCSYYIEHKAGHLVKVAARIQFFFDTTTQVRPVPAAHQGPSLLKPFLLRFVSRCSFRSFISRFLSFCLVSFFVSCFVWCCLQINYSVWCIDEVLGSEMPSIPFKGNRRFPPPHSNPTPPFKRWS
jgi:hypothetical protein